MNNREYDLIGPDGNMGTINLDDIDDLRQLCRDMLFALKNTKALIDGESPSLWGDADLETINNAIMKADELLRN